MSAGQEFAKKLGIFGCVLLLVVYILYLIICFTAKPSEQESEPQGSPAVSETGAENAPEAAYYAITERMLSI